MTTNHIEQHILDFANKAVHFIENNDNDIDNDNDDDELYKLLDLYHDLCCNILDSNISENIKEFNLSIIYRLIYFTNELTNQQATPNYALTYRMIHELNCVFNAEFYQPLLKQLAKNAITDIIQINLEERPLVCWQELPHLLHYIYYNNERYTPDEDDDKFFQHIIEIIVTRLLVDSVKTALDMPSSTLAFWLPKEKSKRLGYLTHPISYDLYSYWIKTAECPDSLDRAKTKCLTHYRKLITKLKSHLDLETLRAQHSKAQHSRAQHSKAQHSKAQQSKAQHSKAQHSKAQHSKAQHSKAQQSPGDTKSVSVLATALVSTIEAVQSIVRHYCIKPKNKYNSYTHLLSDLCRESFIVKREEMSQMWHTILYGDMPELISAQAQEQSDIEEDNIEEDNIEEDNIEEDNIEEDNIEEDNIEEDNIEEEQQQSDDDEELVEITSAAPNVGWFSWFFNSRK
jgi:hypothetical protein